MRGGGVVLSVVCLGVGVRRWVVGWAHGWLSVGCVGGVDKGMIGKINWCGCGLGRAGAEDGRWGFG